MQESYYTIPPLYAITMRNILKSISRNRDKSRFLEIHKDSSGTWKTGQWYRARRLHTGIWRLEPLDIYEHTSGHF